MNPRDWQVRVHRGTVSVELGTVTETTEALARCAALSRFGVEEEELEAAGIRLRREAIYPDEDFDVSPVAGGRP